MDTSAWVYCLFQFAFFYPIMMAFFWISGGLYYFFRRERKSRPRNAPPPIVEYPLASLLIPCHNESDNLDETIGSALAQRYPNYEVIAINDGSRDDTGARLDVLAARHPRLRVIHLDRNLGKANALRMGALASRSEYLICIDGDAMLEEFAMHWMIWHLSSGPRVGAVTGNPRIRNRSTLLGRLQVAEFSSIIGMIKRAQRVYGRIFTVSGVIAGFRRTALHRIGYWADDMMTEDIDISWRLQLDHWDIRYEPNALCFILMPETLKGLWGQRLRWAQGGVEVLLRHGPSLFSWRKRRMWGVLLEYITSVLWAYSIVLIAVLWAPRQFFALLATGHIQALLPQWHAAAMVLVCLLQFASSLIIDRRYEKGIGRNYFWVIWYPIAYWLLSLCTTVVALPKTLLKRRGKRAVWVSPDRGIR
ncbi:poly-beta-1,6-N-acetyl-D-glucosamine synthase [Xanthomonas axonopodis pv. vasculorum]|uniref:Poly-beta-1,6-N-acetyl-D-glucosamine synthase n=1 Tax=Xanthomonas axonopodis pv. vasculorum TaxID=325777 RepID=A0A098Q1I8_9XANT|nr:poly-beta-1,6-N-acetyl-D-glucosamine synthase [Xanthomonas axonopodis]KGE53205.1 N-glycosyltransferase [Xanthomonas axonopodis pv. vasculorum]PPV09318.1 poly-beta-1,6 N-acetyl-D-glucosamine synthase [Xanthomonas axonopodis pv. vasculorum]QKD87853.1 poly-beta-1,6 N-acetyl-D-glucosamine synthase [Xanthomonas axonopodis pv. vasculorum]